MNLRSKVANNAIWSMAQTIISAAVLFLLYRYLLKTIGPAQLGLWSLILASTSLARIGELGFASATLRFVGKYISEDELLAASEILETALITISLPLAMLLVLCIPVLEYILHHLIPKDQISAAFEILPWAMLSLWLGIITSLIQSAIDACGRMNRRNIALITTNIIYLLLALKLVPIYGLLGLAIAQTAQAIILTIIVWCLIRLELCTLPLIPIHWKLNRFKEIYRFALSMQIASIAGMTVEPITKALISKFGGLEFLAYYEMANQVVGRARGILISGFQALLPVFAGTKQDDVLALRMLYEKSYQKVVALGIPYMCVLILAFPLLSILWIGDENLIFIRMGLLIGITWLIATISIPAYFFCVGTGRGLVIAISQILMAVFTLLFGYLAGSLLGGYGVVIGAMLSFLLASAVLMTKVKNTIGSWKIIDEMPKIDIHRNFIFIYATCTFVTSIGVVLNFIFVPLILKALIFGLTSLILALIAKYSTTLSGPTMAK